MVGCSLRFVRGPTLASFSKLITSLAEGWLSIKVPGNDIARFSEPRLIEVMEVVAVVQPVTDLGYCNLAAAGKPTSHRSKRLPYDGKPIKSTQTSSEQDQQSVV